MGLRLAGLAVAVPGGTLALLPGRRHGWRQEEGQEEEQEEVCPSSASASPSSCRGTAGAHERRSFDASCHHFAAHPLILHGGHGTAAELHIRCPPAELHVCCTSDDSVCGSPPICGAGRSPSICGPGAVRSPSIYSSPPICGTASVRIPGLCCSCDWNNVLRCGPRRSRRLNASAPSVSCG